MNTTTGHTHLDRKELKKPDTILLKISSFFQFFQKNLKPVLVVVAVLVLLVAAVFAYRGVQASRAQQAASAMYLATKSLKATLQAMPKDPAGWQEKIKPGVEEIEKLSIKHAGTAAAFEGWVFLAKTFSEKGDNITAAHYFERAASETKEVFLKASALLQAGLIFEDLKKPDEAARVLSVALSPKEKVFRPSVLLALGRNYATLGNLPKATETYDMVLKEFPNTPHSVTAEQQKKLLEKK